MIFPDTRAAILSLIDGTTHEALGQSHTVTAWYHQPADDYGQPVGDFPQAVVYATGGTEGWVDRVDQITVELFAARGELAVRVLESIKDAITGENIETPEGFLDTVAVRTVPVDVPYQNASLSKAQMALEVITRPSKPRLGNH